MRRFGGIQYEQQVLMAVTLIVGAVVGLVIVLFILLTENLGARLYPAESAAWRRVLIPVFGSLAAGVLLWRYFPDARGSGIPQAKTALFLRDGYISLRTVIGKFSLCSISLASGIALGREGPSVHVGAGVSSVIGRRLGLSPASVKALAPAGSSAALAAAFNTPLSAVLFTLEEVMGDMHAPVLGSIVLSSATSWIVLHLILGDEPLFHVPAYQLVHPAEFVLYALLGALGGLVSTGFVKLLLWQRKRFLAAPRRTRPFLPVVGGLTVGLLGWFFPEVLGVGYATVGKALNGQMAMGAMALLVVLKLAATSTCYASGNAGGIFGPSLFIGAMMGGAVGALAHTAFPDYTGSAGAYALVGMGTAFAGIIRAPMTSVIMVFEITRDYTIIVPLMISNMVSYFIASRLQREPIYQALEQQDGIHLPMGARAREDLLTVGHAYRPEGQVLSASERVEQAAAAVESGADCWPVVDPGGLRGMISRKEIEEALSSGRAHAEIGELVPSPGPVETLMAANFPHVHPDHPLETAMKRVSLSRARVLPVVSRADIRELKGTISVDDILAAYSVGRRTAPGEPPSQRPASMSLVGAVLGAIAIIGIAAASIGYYYRAERGTRAKQAYEAGTELARTGRFAEAVERFRYALSVSHDPEHRQALAMALVSADRLNEAAIYLRQTLRDRPNSGPASLGMARVYAQEGDVNEAVLAYRRAIYGRWAEEPEAARTRARMELIRFLATHKRAAASNAELIALAADPSDDAAVQKQVGKMLMEFGAPKQAADLYRRLLSEGPPDAEENIGLGEAALAMGNYRTARDAFRRALEIEPDNAAAASRLAIADRVLALDPTQRGTGARERFRRSELLLQSVLDEVASCAQAGQAGLGPDVEAARKALAERRRPRSFSDAAEAGIALAEKLWAKRRADCPVPPGDEALARVMTHLAER